MTFRLVRELAARGVLVAVACRVLRVSTSGYYEWRERGPSVRARADEALSAQIHAIHAYSRGTYGVPRERLHTTRSVPVRSPRAPSSRIASSARFS